MPTIINTDSVAPAARIDYWHCRIRETFGIDYRVEPTAEAPFLTRLTSYAIGPMSFTEIAGQSFMTRRPGQPGSDRLFVVALVEGECTVRHAGSESRLLPGCFCVCAVKLDAEFVFHGKVRYFLLGIAESRLAAQCPDWRKLLAAPVGCGSGEAAMFMESLASLWRQQQILKSPRAKSIADCTVALLASALAAAAEAHHRVSSRMESFHKERIRSFVETELQNSELDIALISQAVGLSSRYIHRLFAGEPLHLMQWVWARRLECCYSELVQNRAAKRAISEIAYSWGFNDPAHFSKVFRKHFGVSPREARGTPATPAQQKTILL